MFQRAVYPDLMMLLLLLGLGLLGLAPEHAPYRVAVHAKLSCKFHSSFAGLVSSDELRFLDRGEAGLVLPFRDLLA
jgi:hypothetical protein